MSTREMAKPTVRCQCDHDVIAPGEKNAKRTRETNSEWQVVRRERLTRRECDARNAKLRQF